MATEPCAACGTVRSASDPCPVCGAAPRSPDVAAEGAERSIGGPSSLPVVGRATGGPTAAQPAAPVPGRVRAGPSRRLLLLPALVLAVLVAIVVSAGREEGGAPAGTPIAPADAAGAGLADGAVEEHRAPTIEEIANAEVPELCGHPATTLVDGQNLDIGPGEGWYEIQRELVDGPGYLEAALDSEIGPLTVIIADCVYGGTGVPHFIQLFGPGVAFYAETNLYEEVDWESIGLSWPAREGIERIEAVDGELLLVRLAAGRYEDPSCCPTGQAEVTLAVDGARIQVVAARNLQQGGGD